MNDDLRQLEDLTRILLDAELATLRRLSRETQAHQADIARLNAALAARSVALRAPGMADDLALATGRDALWQDWVAGARRRLTREAAEAAARREAQRKRAERAFGRVEALKGLQLLEDEDRRLRAARRLLADPDGSGRSG